MTVLRPKDPLLEGEAQTINFYGPKSLMEALKRNAAIDGFKKLSPYIVELLAFAVRSRETERAALEAAQRAKK
jgi:hypothetical protein